MTSKDARLPRQISSPLITRETLLGLTAISIYAVIGFLTLTNGHDWGDDWAQYVNHARNLVEGNSYTETGYIFNPHRPHIGPTNYSPGWPIILALGIQLFGINFPILKTVSLACLTLSMIPAYYVLRSSLGVTVAAAAILLFGANDFIWAMRDSLNSEPAYMLLSFMALAIAAIPAHIKPYTSSLLIGLLSYASISIRPIGICIPLAVLTSELLLGRIKSIRFQVVLVTIVAGIVVQKNLLVLPDYSAELHFPTVSLILSNVEGYWKAIGYIFPPSGKLTRITVFPLIIALALFGIIKRLNTPKSLAIDTSSAGKSRPQSRVPIELWYAIFYVGLLIALPFAPNERYIAPVLPVILGYAVYGVMSLTAAWPMRRVFLASLSVCCVGYYSALHIFHASNNDGGALCKDCVELYNAIDKSTDSDAEIAFIKPRALALMTRRRSWVWSDTLESDDLWNEATEAGVNYLVTVAPSSEFSVDYPKALSWDGWKSKAGVSIVFENKTFRLLRIRSSAAKSEAASTLGS